MVIRPGTHFFEPECVICRNSFGKGRTWRQDRGSLCPRCKRDLERLEKAAARQKAGAKRFRFRFGLFDRPEDSARAEEILNKPDSELTAVEREWVHELMKRILREGSPRGRKADAEFERIERLLVRLQIAGKPRPSYGQIAELLPPKSSQPRYALTQRPQRDRILQALKRRRKAALLQPPPPPGSKPE